jgi:L-rhamnose mutarotase
VTKNRICLACDLKDDHALIEAYKKYHAAGYAWPEITQSIKDAGIEDMEIYLTGNRLFMIMEVNDAFDPGKKSAMDASNPKVEEWESLMDQFQLRLPWAKPGEKWVEMEQIFRLA